MNKNKELKELYKKEKGLVTQISLKKFVTIILTYGIVIGAVGYVWGPVFLANSIIMKLVYLSAAYKIFETGHEYIRNTYIVTKEYLDKLSSSEIIVTVEDVSDEELKKANYVNSKVVSEEKQNIDTLFNNMSREEQINFLNRQKDILNDYNDIDRQYQKTL